MWVWSLVPGPENEPPYPAFQGEFFFLILIGRKLLCSVQGGFLTTGPQGKSQEGSTFNGLGA